MQAKDALILSAVYTEWKMVKTRNSLVLCFEVPLEQQALVQNVLGTPLPGEATHVAICRLQAAGEAPAQPEALPPPREYKLAAQAAMLCNELPFQRWLGTDAEGAADEVRLRCDVTSRAELDRNPSAARRFRDMRNDYKLWLQDVEA